MMDFFTRFSDDIDHTASSYRTKSDQYELHKMLLNAKDQLKKTGKLRLEKQCAQEYLVIEISVYMGADALLVRKEHWNVDRTNLRKKKLTEIKRSIDNFVDDDLYNLITDGKYKIL